MKKNLSSCLLLLLLCTAVSELTAQNLFSSQISSFDQDTKLQSRLLYNPEFGKTFVFKYTADTDWELNKRINQEFKTSSHNWQTAKQFGRLRQVNFIEYKKSDYNSSTQTNDKILTDSGGIGQMLEYSFTDSLIIRGRVNYFYSREEHTADSKTYISNGPGNNAEIMYNTFLFKGRMNFFSIYEDRFTDARTYSKVTSDLGWNYLQDERFINIALNHSLNKEKIMATSSTNEDFIVADDQSISNLSFNALYYDILGDNVPISFENRFRSSNYSVDNNVLKNSDDWTNESYASLSMPFSDRISLNTDCSYIYFEKNYETGTASRREETRRILGGVSYKLRDADTLNVNYSRQLFRRIYPNTQQDADKDNLTDYFNASARIYVTKSIFTELALAWNKHEEIYINGTYSGNNNKKTVWDLQPKLKILMNDYLVLSQKYQLYASYKDYDFSETGSFSDRFYRRLKAEYALTWNNQPLITQESAFRRYALRLPVKRDYFQTELRYSYSESEDGSKIDDYYLITVKNLDYSLEWEFKNNYRGLLSTITPKFNWGDEEILEVTFDSVFAFIEQSFVHLRINPEFEKGRESIWDARVELEYSF
jgi:hypothetical protein